MYIVLWVFGLHLSFSLAFTSNRSCETLEDCGHGECCLGEDGKNLCECPDFIREIYTVNDDNICDKLNIKECSDQCNGSPCHPVLGGYFCDCIEDYVGKACDTKFGENKKRMVGLAVAYKVTDRCMTDRPLLVFVESFGTNFHMEVLFTYETQIYKPHDFVRFQSAKKECLREKIPEEVCSLVPDKPMFGLRHTFFFEYVHIEAIYPFPKSHTYELWVTLNNLGLTQFSTDYKMISAIETKDSVCSPTARLDNCGLTEDGMVKKLQGSSLIIKASIFTSIECPVIPTSLTYEWKLFSVSSTVNTKMEHPPIHTAVGGTFYEIGAFTYPNGLYRLDIWLSALVVTDTVKTYTNFAYCYFRIVDMPIQANIKGGISRSVYKGTPLTLDSSGSYNHNVPNHDHLHYLWSCNVDLPACKERELTETLFRPSLRNLNGDITFTLKAKSSISGSISKPVSQTITFTDNVIPELSIQCLKNCGTQEYPARVDDAIYLQVIDLKHGRGDFDFTWKCLDESGNEIHDFEKMREEGHDRYQLVVKENSFSPGKKYTFVAEGGQVGNLGSSTEPPEPPLHRRSAMTGRGGNQQLGKAAYQVKMADEIKVGDCKFEPPSGQKMKTRFEIQCSNFNTTVEPNILRYEFFNVLPGKHEMDVSLGSSLSRDNGDILLISKNIYIIVCDLFENCGKKKLSIEIPITISDYQTVEQMSPIIHLVLLTVSESFETYVPAEAISIASQLINKISYALFHKIEIPSFSFYDDYLKDFFTPAKYLVSAIGTMLASRNKLIESHDSEHPQYAATLFKYRRATKQSISSLDLISSSLVKGLLQGQKEITFDYDPISVWVKVDTLLKMTHPIPDERDSHLKISDKLAKALSKPLDSFSVSVFVIKNDLFWWKVLVGYDINTDFIVVTVREKRDDGSFSGLVDALPNELDVFLTMKKNVSSLIKGSTALPPAASDDDVMKDKSVSVHRLDIPTLEGQFHIKFIDMKSDSGLRLALEINMRPDYELMMSDRAKNVIAGATEFTVPFEANRGFDFFYIGLLPANNTGENVSIDYSIEIFDSSCSSWIGDEWRSGICKPGKIGNNMLNCRCKHLSLFAGSIFVAPNKVDPIKDVDLFLTVFDNPYIAVIVLLCLIFYVLLLLWAWRKDKQDDSYAKLIRVRDNMLGDTNAYVVVAYTGIRIAAGTTSNVGIQIFGSEASSRAHILKGDDVNRKVLQRASDDWFLLFTPSPLGKLEQIHIWLDFSGSSPSWYCSKIVIIDVALGDEYIFMVGRWLTILLDNGELELLWNCAPTEKTKKVTELAQFNTIYGFREGHAWSAVFNRHPRSPITRKERLSVSLCFLLNTMLLSLMFYGAARGANMDYSSYTLKMRDIMIAVESMIISAPVSFLIVYCFKKSRGRIEKVDKRSRRKGGGIWGFLSYHVPSIFEGVLTFKPLQPVIVTSEVEAIKKNRVWFLFGWGLCVVFILLDSYLIVLYSLKFGRKKSLYWLTAVTLGQFQGTFVFEPVKVTLFAVLLAVIFRKRPRVATYKIKDLKPEEMISSDISPTIRNGDEYKPPTIEKIEELKKTYVPYWEQKWLLFNLIATSTMIILFALVIREIGNTQLYYNSAHVTEMLTAPKHGTIGFNNVTNCTQFYKYMKENLLPSLYVTSCYGENSTQIPFTTDCMNHLVKIPQIRQRRVVRGLCRVPEILRNVSDECQAQLNDETEDKATYEYSWQKVDKHSLNKDEESPWKYLEEIEEKDEKHKRRLRKVELTVPALNGYTAKLDRTLQTSVEKLTYLRNNNWIDSLTRELFVEFILYNTNTNMFCLVRLQLTHPANGVYRTHIEVNSTIIDGIKIDYLVLLCILGIICTILLLAWRALSNIQLYGVFGYATRSGKIWEFCAVVTGLFFIFWLFAKYLDFFMYSQHTKQSFQHDYIPFSVIGLKTKVKFIIMYLMGFVTMVFIYSFRFGKPYEVIVSTIWYSTPRVFAIAKMSLVFVSIVEMMFILSQNPPLFGLVYPFHYQSHLSRAKCLFASKSLEFSLRFIFYIAHTLSLVFVLIFYIESRYLCVGRKSYNLWHFVCENLLRKCRKQN